MSPNSPPIIELADEAETRALGARFAPCLRQGDLICLEGDLGAGKTTFARGLITAAAARAGAPVEEVASPTFTLVQTYDLGDVTIAHFDLYRIEDPAELEELGLEDALDEGVCLVEWPARGGARLPADRVRVSLETAGTGRRARLSAEGPAAQRLLACVEGA